MIHQHCHKPYAGNFVWWTDQICKTFIKYMIKNNGRLNGANGRMQVNQKNKYKYVKRQIQVCQWMARARLTCGGQN